MIWLRAEKDSSLAMSSLVLSDYTVRTITASCVYGQWFRSASLAFGIWHSALTRHTRLLAAAERGQQEDLRAVADGCLEPACVACVLAVHEDVDVGTDLAELGDHAVSDRRTLRPQQRQRARERAGRAVDADLGTSGHLAQRARDDEEDRHQTTAALTEMIGGSPSTIADHASPSVAEANSFPLRVPKYTPAGSSASTAIASRSTVS